MSKKLMILGGSILQLPAIEKATDMGIEVVVVDMDKTVAGFSVPGVFGEIISTNDIPNVIKAAKKHNIDGIMTLATDMPMRTVAAVCKELNLAGIDTDTALKATNKFAMRNALKQAGVPIPEFFMVSTLEEYLEKTKCFDGPFMVKPADSSGSRGVTLVNGIDDPVFEKAYEYSKEYSNCGEVLVEEYMCGPEVSVETLSLDGVCHIIQITDKITTGAPHFVEIAHSQPTKLDAETVEKISKITEKANRAIGITQGPSHTEIIVTDKGPKIVELGARLGGDNITTHLVPLSTGVDMLKCCIQLALGEKPDIEVGINKGSAIRYFEQHSGIVKRITGIDSAKSIDGVKQVSIVHGVGQKIDEIISSSSRMGFVISQADSPDEALEICKRALDKINVEIGD